MKKFFLINTIILLALMVGFNSCEEIDMTFDQENAFIAFSASSGSVSEIPDTITIEIYYASTATGDVSVTVGFDTVGIAVPAVEGEDYNVLGSKTLSFSAGLVQTIEIETINNDERDFDKTVNLTLTASDDTKIGQGGEAFAVYALTVVDDEHPLANWIGSYAVAAPSYGNPGVWDEAWTCTTAPVDGDPTKLSIIGMAYGDLPVIASVSLDDMTITLPGGADCGGSGYGYDATYIAHGDYNTFTNVGEDVVGTISADGSMAIDELAMLIESGGALYSWDAFNTTWTKSKKKSVAKNVSVIDKVSR